jgi:hypothetical protein
MDERKMADQDFEYAYSDNERGTGTEDDDEYNVVDDTEEFTVDEDEHMEEWIGDGASPAYSSMQTQHTANRTNTNADNNPNTAPSVNFKGTYVMRVQQLSQPVLAHKRACCFCYCFRAN